MIRVFLAGNEVSRSLGLRSRAEQRLARSRHLRRALVKVMDQHFTHLGEEDLKLYKAMRRWHNEVGDMLAYVTDKLVPHGFDEIVKDDFAGLRQMLQRRETSQVAVQLTERMATSGLDIQSLVTAQRKLSDLPQGDRVGDQISSQKHLSRPTNKT